MRRGQHFVIASLIFFTAAVHTALAQQTPADELYSAGKPLLSDLRSQIFGVRDLVSDSRDARDPLMKEYYRKRAQRLVETAKQNAAKLDALIKREEAKGDQADDLAKYTLAALKQQYEAYAGWLADAEAAVASLESQSSPPEEDATETADSTGESEPNDATPPTTSTSNPAPDFPTGEALVRQSRVIMRVKAVLDEIYLEQAHARAAYYREGMDRRMQLAFNRHGATGRHGWIWSWADSLWMHQYGYVSDARYGNFRVAAEKFLAHVMRTEEITIAHLEYTDRLVDTLAVWRDDIRQQYDTLDAIIDLYGQIGAAGEQGDEERSERAEAEANRLLEKLHEPSPVVIEPFQW